MAQNQSVNVYLFDAYFRRADLDCYGRISGNDAVALFQASGLPEPVLAQVLSLFSFFFIYVYMIYLYHSVMIVYL
ncbi:hypothetical protein ACE6H2_012615 [Prunus campanulata]